MNCKIPAKISAGLSFDSLHRFDTYQAPEWSLSLLLRGPSTITLTSVAEGPQHRFAFGSGVTSTWAPGVYSYSLRATRGDDVVEVGRGQLNITPDLAGLADGSEVRSPAQIALAAIEAVIAKRATMDQERYRINNRELYRTSIGDLLKLRDMYRGEVRREQCAGAGLSQWGRTVRVRLQ